MCSQEDLVGEVVSEAKLLEYVQIPELLSPGGIVTKKESSSCGSSLINASPRSQHGTGYNDKEPLKFHAKFTRRFIEMDDEMVSVMSGNSITSFRQKLEIQYFLKNYCVI